MTENELERAVRDLIKLRGLFGYHTRNSIGSQPGFPDWVIVSTTGVLWRELKTEAGVLSPAQSRVRNLLLAAGQDWGLWRPSDLRSGRIEAELAVLAGRS